MKSNGNLSVIKSLVDLGAGIDIVSIGELGKALLAGADPKKIVFASVGKTEEEISFAIETGINGQSPEERLKVRTEQSVPVLEALKSLRKFYPDVKVHLLSDKGEDFSDIAEEIRNSAEDADLLLGELKRDVIDYDTIKAALSKMSQNQKKNLPWN